MIKCLQYQSGDIYMDIAFNNNWLFTEDFEKALTTQKPYVFPTR